jgi:hypothetical protein
MPAAPMLWLFNLLGLLDLSRTIMSASQSEPKNVQ